MMAAMLLLFLLCACCYLTRGNQVSRPLLPLLLSKLSGGHLETGSVIIDGTPAVKDDATNASLKAVDYHLLPEWLDPQAAALAMKYSGKVVFCRIPQYPTCDIVLCGTVHVAGYSALMVKDVIDVLRPSFVVLELCETRVDSLLEPSPQELREAVNVTLPHVLRESVRTKSFKVLGMGLLSWMQLKAARMTGNKLGGELATAARAAHAHNSAVVLGDRLYAVTIQRVFDRLRTREKLLMAAMLLWEVLTMSFLKINDYIKRTKDDEPFIKEEIRKFHKHLPALANIIISERDEYLAATVCEIARVRASAGGAGGGRSTVLAVVGAGHLEGLQRWLLAGGSNDTRIAEISSSSKHASTWPGRGMLHVVNTAALFRDEVSRAREGAAVDSPAA